MFSLMKKKKVFLQGPGQEVGGGDISQTALLWLAVVIQPRFEKRCRYAIIYFQPASPFDKRSPLQEAFLSCPYKSNK